MIRAVAYYKMFAFPHNGQIFVCPPIFRFVGNIGVWKLAPQLGLHPSFILSENKNMCVWETFREPGQGTMIEFYVHQNPPVLGGHFFETTYSQRHRRGFGADARQLHLRLRWQSRSKPKFPADFVGDRLKMPFALPVSPKIQFPSAQAGERSLLIDKPPPTLTYT